MRIIAFAVPALLCAGMAAAQGDRDPLDARAQVPPVEFRSAPFGRAAAPGKAKRTVRVDMTDQMRFVPAEVTVKRGEVVRFLPANKGQVMHEMVLGTMDELRKHAALMKKHPGMEHEEPHMAHVPPGKQREIGWQFTRAGEFFFACLIPGHFDAGMVGKVIVTP